MLKIVRSCKQYPTGIPVAIPVTAGIRGFARIPVPAKFLFFCRDSLPGFYTKFRYKNLPKN